MPCLYLLQKEKVEELQSIIRQSAKERLWLERQISNGDSSRSPSPQILAGDLAAEIKKKSERLSIMEEENKNLKYSVAHLQKAEAESLKLVGGVFCCFEYSQSSLSGHSRKWAALLTATLTKPCLNYYI